MRNDKESPYTLTLLNDDLSLQVVRFSGREALNQPYRFEIEALGAHPAVNVDTWLQQPAFLRLGHDSGFHGVLHSVSWEWRGPQQVAYKLVLMPALQTLDKRRCRRVFQQLSVPMILRRLLVEHDLPDDSYRFELATGHYPLRPFCIQYEESDLALLQRLCEEEGIHYHFEHTRQAHVLVFAEDCLSFPQAPLSMSLDSDGTETGSAPVLSELFQRHAAPAVSPPLETHDPGQAQVDDIAANHPFDQTLPPLMRPTLEQRHRDQLARRHLERLRCRQVQVQGHSNHDRLRSASIVQVAEHPLSPFNDQWLVIEARHKGHAGTIPTENASDMTPRYRNEFTAIPWSTVFRPGLEQLRPSVPGHQPARVCGAVGQPTVLDDHGRIQVSLWPTPGTHADACDGIWMPLALAAPDHCIDPSELPLAGSDGLVSFLDGDPDRPVFCASLAQRPPPRPARAPAPCSDTRLLLDWLIKPGNTD
ncbi:type VI secretion system Vgr family protein [Pseudomonas sp. KK4]|uniref:type VI secretion system Vgr family protein n=1 Tax=Pseudomonas sp. KK4 TaxID=1855729 RepID=UPI00097C39A6|nr:type VI secretion system tip protein TssI/VgrG [Pseudomonas sp. KK4]